MVNFKQTMQLALKQSCATRRRRPPRILLAMLLTLLLVGAARAETWYVMAPDEKLMSRPDVAATMHQGASVGPIHLTSKGEFPSRQKCEAARSAIVRDWRKRGVISHGSWNRHGISSANPFIVCTTGADPRMARSPVGAGGIRSMEILLHPSHYNYRR
jgi:hypothetical protein